MARWRAGQPVGHRGATVYPMAGYTYLRFDGSNDQLWEFRSQVHQPFQVGARALWYGASG